MKSPSALVENILLLALYILLVFTFDMISLCPIWRLAKGVAPPSTQDSWRRPGLNKQQ